MRTRVGWPVRALVQGGPVVRSTSITLIAVASLTSLTSVVLAQPDPSAPAGDPAATDASAIPGDAAAAPAPADDMSTTSSAQVQPAPMASSTSGLRNGFSALASYESGGRGGVAFSGSLFGVDWRIGYRISEPLSVYLQSHMSFGSVSGAETGFTGNFASALMAEYMLPMRLFFAGGAGWGVLNNPNGPLAAARVGYYPFETKAAGKVRRLNVALDARFYFPEAPYDTTSQWALSVGYDRF